MDNGLFREPFESNPVRKVEVHLVFACFRYRDT
jgi:hypothetical protein